MSDESGELDDINKTPTIDIWAIIDTYFRDTMYYKSQHQLDSYDEFIYSEVNGIRHIIKRGNPLLIYKEPLNVEATEYKYDMEIYFGETLDEDGLFNDKVENIFVSSPIEYNEGESKYMFPNIARLKGYTYKSNIFCNIGVKYKDNETGKVTIVNFPKVNIFRDPGGLSSTSSTIIDFSISPPKVIRKGDAPYPL